MQHEVHEHHRRQLEYAPEVHNLDELLRRQLRQLFKTWIEVLGIPAVQILRVLDGIRPRSRAEIERARRQGIHEPHFRSHDVPRQVQSALRDSVRTIVPLIQRNCLDHALRDAVLVLEAVKIDTMEQKTSLIGLNWLHWSRISQTRDSHEQI